MLVGNLRSRRRTRDVGWAIRNRCPWCAGLIAETLKLSGPQMTIDAACASSLVALALGCLALQHAEIENGHRRRCFIQ